MKIESRIKLLIPTVPYGNCELIAAVELNSEDFPGEDLQSKSIAMVKHQVLCMKEDLDALDEKVFKLKSGR